MQQWCYIATQAFLFCEMIMIHKDHIVKLALLSLPNRDMTICLSKKKRNMTKSGVIKGYSLTSTPEYPRRVEIERLVSFVVEYDVILRLQIS